MIKRTVDIAGAFCGLVVLLPVIVVVAVWIKADSSGPVFYVQERIGKNGAAFRLFKFRTMTIHADKAQVITVGARDARITRAGYWLRRFKIDELPQLINVLAGDMSLVGPRPELRRFTDLYTEHQRRVLSVRPGITDPASIKFRNENELLAGQPDPVNYYVTQILPEKLELNLKYIDGRSFFGDIKVILQTIFSILRK